MIDSGACDDNHETYIAMLEGNGERVTRACTINAHGLKYLGNL